VKRLLGNLSVLALSTVFGLIFLETAYRFYLFGWDAFSIEKVNSVNALGLSDLLQPSSNPDLVFELKPNVDTYFKLVPFQTNTHGLRDKEYPIDKPDGVFRVAVLGDSFTLPSGVAIEDAFHSVLEDRLSAGNELVRYEFINFAVGAYTLQQYLSAIRHKAMEYDPDLILIGFCAGNDHKVFLPHRFPDRYRPKGRTYPFYGSFAVNAVALKLQESRVEEERGRLTDRQARYLEKVFRELATLGEAEDIPVVLVYLSNQEENYKPIEELALANGIEHFLDVSSAFRGTNLSDYRILPIDNHPNAQAHQIFADRIYEYLVQKDLLRKRP
jgi:lysophospholipase L1-like esterase